MILSLYILLCLPSISDKISTSDTGKVVTLFGSGNSNAKIVSGEDSKGDAWGFIDDQISEDGNGWARLDLKTNTLLSYKHRAFGLGFLEGYLTANRILFWYDNWIAYIWGNSTFGSGTFPHELDDFITNQTKWMDDMIAKHSHDRDGYWEFMELLYLQLDSMAKGVVKKLNGTVSHEEVYRKILRMNYFQDLFELSAKFAPSKDIRQSCTGCGVDAYVRDLLGSHCSAFVKRTEDDMFFAHNTWFGYPVMSSFYKVSELNGFGAGATRFSQSTFPGMLFGGQDFLILNNNQVLVSTTNVVLNDESLKDLDAESVPGFMRFLAAMRQTQNPLDFLQMTSWFNSGTYNNQWMLTDLNALHGNSKDKLFYVADQSPKDVYYTDESETLAQKGYWASYNRPYFKSVYEEFGFPEAVKAYGNEYSYENCARAKIFRREAPSISSMESLQKLMTYNQFETDPLSNGSPMLTIAARGDLMSNYTCHMACYLEGALDAKITNISLASDLKMLGIASPTHVDQPVFRWTLDRIKDFTARSGQPETFDFDWIVLEPYFK